MIGLPPHARPRAPVALALATALLAAAAPPPAGLVAQEAPLPSIAEHTRGMEAQPGFLPVYWDAAEGRLLLEIPRFDEPFLYLTSLATGLGSNDLGLDRGEIMDEHVARFERVGPKALLVLENPGFRATNGASAALERSVAESFPTSTVGAFRAVAEQDGRLLVDATAFFLNDVADVVETLRRADQGSFSLDRERSAIWLPRTRAFPDNAEVEATLTFASDRPGPEVRRHTPDAFRIEDMPEDMDPMDARYNVIQWVHRTEAGSSIGPSFRDPRTGEIIKAAVRMDSYRSLANYNTYAAFAGVDGEGFGAGGPGVDPEEYVMMRRRQHAAHEIGHTLGLAHNFIAISYGHGSVMDYPAPVVALDGERIDLSGAYRNGPGAYDTLAIRYAYASPPEGASEDAFLDGLLLEAQERGWHFITNPDAGADNAHPAASWWVNGADPLDELARVMDVRRVALERFDERAIAPGEPMHKLWQRLAPVYFHHRATYEAAIKTIGGMEYRYGVRGDPLPPTDVEPVERVRRAMELLSAALAPEALAIPERILAQLAPEPYGWKGGRPVFATAADPAFDQVGAARTLASEIVGGVLHPTRAARVVAFHARDSSLPALEEVVGWLIDDAWGRPAADEADVLGRVVQGVVAAELLALATAADATVEARAAAEWGLRRILERLDLDNPAAAPPAEAHRERIAAAIGRFLARDWSAEQRPRVLQGPSWARDVPARGGGR